MLGANYIMFQKHKFFRERINVGGSTYPLFFSYDVNQINKHNKRKKGSNIL